MGSILNFFSVIGLASIFSKIVAFVLSFLILVIILYIIASKIGKSFSLGFGPLKFSFPGKKNSLANVTLVLDKVKYLTKFCTEENEKLKNDTLRKQLSYTEDVVNEIKTKMVEIYYDYLKTKLPDEEKQNVKSHKEYRNYQILLQVALTKSIINLMKKIFKENHLENLNLTELKEFVEKKTETSLSEITNFLDLLYNADSIVSREELYQINETLKYFYKGSASNIIKRGKEIAEKNKKKIEENEMILKEKIEQLVKENLK